MKTNKTVQQYIGYMLSISEALLWDNSSIAIENARDEKSFIMAKEIIEKIFDRELYKNQNRIDGMESSFDSIGENVTFYDEEE